MQGKPPKKPNDNSKNNNTKTEILGKKPINKSSNPASNDLNNLTQKTMIMKNKKSGNYNPGTNSQNPSNINNIINNIDNNSNNDNIFDSNIGINNIKESNNSQIQMSLINMKFNNNNNNSSINNSNNQFLKNNLQNNNNKFYMNNNNNNNNKFNQYNNKQSYQQPVKVMDEKKKKELKKKIQEETLLEEQIRDHLKCYICLGKVLKPRMCKFCKKICCEECIKKWLEDHDFCGMCKRRCHFNDMISIPFLDDMSAFFIKNIDNRPKLSIKEVNSDNFDPDKNLNILMNNNPEMNNIMMNNSNMNNMNNVNMATPRGGSLCPNHNNPLQFYCIQCDQEFCNECLIFFNSEVSKHNKHIIIPINEINSIGINDAIGEYHKLQNTKTKIDDLIGQCNFKLKENEIKKCEIMTFFDSIKDKYINLLSNNTNDINSILKTLKDKKETIDQYTFSIPKAFESALQQQNYNQFNIFSRELQKINNIQGNFAQDILEKSNINPKLFYETYYSDEIEFKIPPENQIMEGQEILNKKLDFIKDHPCNLVLKYIVDQIMFTLAITIGRKVKNNPIFYSCIIMRNKKYGSEFVNLSEQIDNSNREQVNTIGFPLQQFFSLRNEQNMIKLKIFVIKTHYEK